MDLDRFIAMIILDEGERLKPYRCSEGKLTIGIGRNLEDVGITHTESRFLFENDLVRVWADLDILTPFWRELDDVRQEVLAAMCFQMGRPRLSGFKKFLAALEAGDYERAADEMLDSLWARQTPERAEKMAEMMRTGEVAV